ncbi:MAG TPA: hypothetical protein VNP93_11200 [Gaiellaceae bacterium]|nr:hypothetical protein [Gaiellaceae bacterium]
MHTIAAGEPPLSPETIGRAPSNFDAPVPLVPFDELVRRKTAAQAGVPASPIAAIERLRVVVRLLGGDELEVGTYVDEDGATTRAKELVAHLAAAEAAGEWPEVEGRHLRPASIVSVDVLTS